MGCGLDIGFIDDLCTPLRTTSNYSAIANLHVSQVTTAYAKPFPACYVFTSHSLATAFFTVEIIQLSAPTSLLSGDIPHLNSCVDWILDLLTTYTHHSELQVITALLLISMSQITTAHAKSFPACCVFTDYSLAVALNSGDSSAFHAYIVTVWRYPTSELLSTVSSTTAPSLLSLPCRV
jgi:hypothetical protein